ncbi:MAG: hypothetical protein ABIJ26_08485, partial [Candidatus Margulisiibacteriota bacterium]
RYFLHGFRLKDDFKNSPMIIYSRFHVSPRRGRETTSGDPATRLEVWLNGFRFQGEAGRRASVLPAASFTGYTCL